MVKKERKVFEKDYGMSTHKGHFNMGQTSPVLYPISEDATYTTCGINMQYDKYLCIVFLRNRNM
jgi:hypothetical protein